MKFLKIFLIVVLLIVMCFAISLGRGTIESGDKTIDLAELKDAGAITSGDKTVTMADIEEMYKSADDFTLETKEAHNPATYWAYRPAEPKTLDEWFCDLKLTEKIKIYNHWNKKNISDWTILPNSDQ